MSYDTVKVYSQPFLYKKWTLEEAGWLDKLKFKLSFGLFGRMEYTSLTQSEMVQYFTGDVVDSSKVKRFQPVRNAPPNSYINCRCYFGERL
ncbi:hypothetical protein VPHK375_0079 [Vibrio phage K375]|nr:hypothetical protein MYOV072v1_p0012 [Vibrio phage 207E29.1]